MISLLYITLGQGHSHSHGSCSHHHHQSHDSNHSHHSVHDSHDILSHSSHSSHSSHHVGNSQIMQGLFCIASNIVFKGPAGIFLHILADTLGSVGVIISSALIYQFGKSLIFLLYFSVYH